MNVACDNDVIKETLAVVWKKMNIGCVLATVAKLCWN